MRISLSFLILLIATALSANAMGEPSQSPLTAKAMELFFQGSYDQVIVYADRALELNSSDVDAWNAKGAALSSLGKMSEAIGCYKKILEINDSGVYNIAALSNMGIAYLNMMMPTSALSCFNDALEIDSNNSVLWTLKGLAILAGGRDSSLGGSIYSQFSGIKNYNALNCFNRSIELNSTFPDAWDGKALALANIGEFQEALNCEDEALKLQPRWSKGWSNKGSIFSMRGQYEDAIDCYNQAIALNPAGVQAWVGKGEALCQLGRYEEALICLERAIQIDPHSYSAWYNKGKVLEALNRPAEANAALEESQKWYPVVIDMGLVE